jgi:hypothetical protein
MYECDVWDFPHLFSTRRFQGEWLERQEFYNQALSRHRLVFGGGLRGLENIQTPDDLYRCHSEHKGAAVWGEKSPVYSVRLSRLGERYPQGSFILVWRDPAEVYRSVKLAGEKSPFFGRPGMLHRLIYHQERMIREAAELECAGVRVYHVNYDTLVDDTAEVCRGVCQFLGLEFEPRMACLERADFTAVYHAPQHDFLRRGVIERQPVARDMVNPACAQKLARFRNRWERLAGRALGLKSDVTAAGEPGWAELRWHQGAGAALHGWDNLKRAGFEFLPLPWLRTYRQFRDWLVARDGFGRKTTLGGELRQHAVTVAASFLLLGLVALFDYATGPEISSGPLYLLPCAALALVAGRHWATVAAVATALSATLFREGSAHHYHLWLTGPTVWNLAMRFIFFEVFVLLLARIRCDLSEPTSSGGRPQRESMEDGGPAKTR